MLPAMHKNGPRPLISICIPVFNGGDLIYRALESCIHQTYENIEIIVSDNGSTDTTKEVVARYMAQDNRIKYYRFKTNVGPTKNFLNAFEHASGYYTQLLAHDDWLSKNYIEECARSFHAHPRTAAVLVGLLSLITLETGRLNFDREAVFKPKTYSADYFFRVMYKSDFGSLFIYSMVRTKDLVEATRFTSRLFDTPSHDLPRQFQELHKKGFGIDIVISQKILSKYNDLVFINSARYIKVTHANNTGGTAGEGVNMQNALGIINNFSYFLLCNEYVYASSLKKYLFGLRVKVANDMLGTILFNFIKNSFRPGYFNGFGSLGSFFKNYSFFELAAVAGSILPSLVFRALYFFIRRSNKNGKFVPSKNYFIDENGMFVV